MKIIVKTLKGSNFPVEVLPTDTASEVKKNIESVQGADVYPAAQQVLIHQGKVLKDDTTMQENNIAENSFVVIMLSKSKSSSGEGSAAATSKAPSAAGVAPLAEASTAPPAAVTSVPIPASQPESASAPVVDQAPVPSPASASGDVYGQAASNLIAGSGLDQTVQQILDMGGGTWDRDTVMRALRAAFNNPERAIEYLYSGIPEQAEIPPPSQPVVAAQPTTAAAAVAQQLTQQAPVPSSGPNANPLNLFPQGLPNLTSGGAGTGALDFLRGEQFQALRAMVQANPQILQPMLQELGKQNPQLVRLIQENQSDFLQLINEPAEGEEGNVLNQLAGAMPQTIEVTPEERDAIERLEAMGFDRATVLEVYFACNKDEMLAANYLLDHMHELQD